MFIAPNILHWTQCSENFLTLQDCIYAISVDKEKKRVLVVFRGAITRPDWNHAFDAALKKGHNPVKDSYEGRSNFIRYVALI